MALMALTNNAEYVWIGDDLSDIQWITEGVKTPSQKEIDDKIAEIKANEETAKTSVQAKLEALGLTVEDLRSIL
mgnify:CR=1 FL=1